MSVDQGRIAASRDPQSSSGERVDVKWVSQITPNLLSSRALVGYLLIYSLTISLYFSKKHGGSAVDQQSSTGIYSIYLIQSLETGANRPRHYGTEENQRTRRFLSREPPGVSGVGVLTCGSCWQSVVRVQQHEVSPPTRRLRGTSFQRRTVSGVLRFHVRPGEVLTLQSLLPGRAVRARLSPHVSRFRRVIGLRNPTRPFALPGCSSAGGW
jgi:hypothetical protein